MTIAVSSIDTEEPDRVDSKAPNRLLQLANISLVRYLLVGGASFMIDIGLLALLYEIARWPLWLSTASAFLASFVFNYMLQRAFSFGGKGSHVGTLIRYGMLLGFNTIAAIGIVAYVDTFAGWQAGKVIATVLSTVWTYFIYKYWVFKSRDPLPPQPSRPPTTES